MLRQAQQPDTAAMFMLACREIHADIITNIDDSEIKSLQLSLPGLNPDNEEVIAVSEYFVEYQKKLVHLCMDSQPFAD